MSAGGSDSGNGQVRACASISYALSRASAGARVLVGPGRYRESANPGGAANLIPPRLAGLTLAADDAGRRSDGATVIDATGELNGILDQADGTTVSGFTVENAQLEGILVEPPPAGWAASATAPAGAAGPRDDRAQCGAAQRCRLRHHGPDPFAACPSSPTDSDDCGEGVHLLGTSYSRVIHNRVSDNVGGIRRTA